MQFYYNATDSPLELPTPKNLGTRIIGVGEGFFGPTYYDQFVLKGLLARTTWGGAIHREFVSEDDFTATDTNSIAPSRYKTNSLTPSPGDNSSIGQLKFVLHYSTEATSQDPVHITYYFYTNRGNATSATHIISLVGVLENDWRFPTWADLPNDFYDLSPLAQKEALLTKR